MMKIERILITCLTVLLFSITAYPQDLRTLDTKVADLLARFPANDLKLTDRLMEDMLMLGDEGIKKICDQIVPPGSGDDTRSRFAVESFSRFLSRPGQETEKGKWETICINYAVDQNDIGVKDFFMKQLQLIGGNKSADAMKIFLSNKDLCEPALAVIISVGGTNSEAILAESLKNKDLPCAAAVMNNLALLNSQKAVNDYIKWSETEDFNIKASAYNALASSGSPLAYPVLEKAARESSYRWEKTGATASFLKYAKVVAGNGNIKTMDRICKYLISACDDNLSIQYKTVALDTYISFHGIEAMSYLLKAASHSNNSYRNAAIRMSLSIPGSVVVQKWIGYFPKATQEAKPEIISMLGIRGDEMAVPLITSLLTDQNLNVRKEASEAIVKISGNKATNSLINYMLLFDDTSDQEAVKSALKTVIGNDEMPLLIPVLKEGSAAARISVIELFAWNKDKQYFSLILPYASSTDKEVKTAALQSLSSLTGSSDQEKLIELLSVEKDSANISHLQTAIAVAAGEIADPEKRSAVILKAMSGNIIKEKLMPVLAKTGGREALAIVLKEFENGSPDMRDICFSTLTDWNDYSASSALFEICASGNKTFENPAFNGYLKQISSAPVSDEQKLLLYRKIMPLARSAERINKVIGQLAELKIYPALYYVSTYLDDPSVSATAAKAIMNIALPSTDAGYGMYGSLVKEILLKATGKLKGDESEYEKEMINKYLSGMIPDEGFRPMFNGKDLTGWQGLVENPVERAKMKPDVLARKQAEANKKVGLNWSVKDGCIWFSGSGDNLCSIKEYGDFEMFVDWKISKDGDSGIYLRGSPQVQIWDTSRVDAGAQVGSGGLYNNQKNPSKPLKVADNPVGDWNTFRILMIDEKVSVWLNGELVVDDVTLENYWDRNIPIFPKGSIELQAHGTDLAFRDIYIREINEKDYNLTAEEKAEGFVALFNGRDLNNWIGNKESYVTENGMIVVKPNDGSGGNLYTEEEYSDFIFRFEFQLTPAANNGLGIRAPLTGNAAYQGMELQIIDNTAPVYAELEPYQYHGSVYGVIPAKTGFLNPVGEWNYEEVIVNGTMIKVILNGTVIVDGDIAGPRDTGTMDHLEHPGLKNKTGHIGFLGHGSELKFRNIRIKGF